LGITLKEETISVRGRGTRLFRGGSGVPLLFLHDTFASSWMPIHEKLSAHYEVFLPVHPGFADSEQGFENFVAIEDMVFHYLDLCEALRVERPVLVGASFGGWIAAEWAIRYSNMESLILIGALGLRLPESPASDILGLDAASCRQMVFADPSSSLALGVVPETPKSEDMVGAILARQTLARFGWQFPDNPQLQRYLYRVRTPTLIVWGERDGFVPAMHGQAYHKGIANSEFVSVPNAGHLPHVEQEMACLQIVLNFLRRSEKPPP
jgi:pimeloyl-ACP methyl ester carboxylesterase